MIQKALNKRLFWGTREMALVVLLGNTLVIKKNYLLEMKKCEPSVARDGSSEREMKYSRYRILAHTRARIRNLQSIVDNIAQSFDEIFQTREASRRS